MDDLLNTYPLVKDPNHSRKFKLGTVQIRLHNDIFYLLEFNDFRPSRRVIERINKTLENQAYNEFKSKINQLKSWLDQTLE